MRLRDIHPEDFLRAGALFGVVAEQVGDTITQSRSCAEVRWVGRPNVQNRQLRAWRDDQDGTATSSLVALTPHEEALLHRDRLLHAEAEDLEQIASRRIAARLHDLADHATRVQGWQGLNRGIARAPNGFMGPVVGTAALAGDAFSSIPGVTDEKSRTQARKQLWEAGAAMLQPWLMVEDFVQQLDQGQYAYAGGSLAGAFVFKGRGGKKEALFGAHDDLPLAVLAALKNVPHAQGLDASRAWVLAHAQEEFLVQINTFRKKAAPTVDELLADGVDLVQQEALGGHTVYKHVGRDLDFLARRQLTETRPGDRPVSASSFASQEEAEYLINRTLRRERNAAAIEAWLSSPEKTDALRLLGPSDGLGALRNNTGTSTGTTYVIVEFKKKNDGSIYLNRAFLDARKE